MRHLPALLVTLILFACSTSNKKEETQVENKDLATKQKTEAKLNNEKNWLSYSDTINIGFTISFNYPQRLFAEHFENAECIGKKIKMVDDGRMTTMDCSIWMDALSDSNVRPIDTLIQYELQQIKSKVSTLKDTIDIANVNGLRVQYVDRANNSRIVKQSIFFIKYDTFFDVENDRLSEADFNAIINSLKIEK